MNVEIQKTHYLLRGLAVWGVIIFVESVHGTLRELFLKPLVGDFRARQIAFFIGIILIFSVALLFVRWMRAANQQQLLQIGLLWLVLTLAFEFGLGLLVMGYSWQRMFEDYDLRKGGLMGFGVMYLLFAPWLAARVRDKVTKN